MLIRKCKNCDVKETKNEENSQEKKTGGIKNG